MFIYIYTSRTYTYRPHINIATHTGVQLAGGARVHRRHVQVASQCVCVCVVCVCIHIYIYMYICIHKHTHTETHTDTHTYTHTHTHTQNSIRMYINIYTHTGVQLAGGARVHRGDIQVAC